MAAGVICRCLLLYPLPVKDCRHPAGWTLGLPEGRGFCRFWNPSSAYHGAGRDCTSRTYGSSGLFSYRVPARQGQERCGDIWQPPVEGTSFAQPWMRSAGRSAAACPTRTRRGLIFPMSGGGDLFLGRNLPCRKGAGRHPSCTSPRPPQSPEGLAPITQLVRCAELASDRWAVCIRLRRMVLRVGVYAGNLLIPLYACGRGYPPIFDTAFPYELFNPSFHTGNARMDFFPTGRAGGDGMFVFFWHINCKISIEIIMLIF